MTRHYLTYFDSHYLPRGLVLYRSLKRHVPDAHLWIICFDDTAHALLMKLALPSVTLVSMKEFENEDLLRVKPTRTRQEYCWTCTAATIRYVLGAAPDVESVTYLDADTMFFSSPAPAIAEAGTSSIVITAHHWLKDYDLSAGSGIHSVQYLTFDRSPESLLALNWWYDRCIEWCFARFEDGKFGDQKYLDDWPERFKGVHVVRHPGIGVAPWNNSRFTFTKSERGVLVDGEPLILYHYHSMKLYKNVSYLYGWYPIAEHVREWIYRPYLDEIAAVRAELRRSAPEFAAGVDRFALPKLHPREIYHFTKGSLQDLRAGRYMRLAET